jgi:hypothetical protein
MNIAHKAHGGLIKLHIIIENAKITEIKITGDFFIYPEEDLFELEEDLRGKTEEESREIIKTFLATVESPGITFNDFEVLLKRAFDTYAVQSH